MNIKMTPCVSSQITAHGYDTDTSTLAMRFKGGAIYHYSGVPANLYADLCRAESVGKFFALHIRAGGFPYTNMPRVVHDLKIWPQYFDDVAEGRMRVQLRKDDRFYMEGDVLNLNEFDPATEQHTGRSVTVDVTHVLRIGEMDATMKQNLGLNPCMAPVNQLAILSIVI